jgi:hypothetical protein
MTGYTADPHALKVTAGKLDDVAREVGAAAAGIDARAGDLGPGGVTEAVDVLAAGLAGRMRAVCSDLTAASANVAAAGAAYLDIEGRSSLGQGD